MSKFFKTWTLADAGSLALSIVVHPSFNYDESITNERETFDSETGIVRQAKQTGGAFNFNVPLEYISSSDTNQIRDWWRSQTKIRFSTVFSDETANYADCRIINKTDPFGNFQKWETTKFKGELNLVSIVDYNTNRGLQQKTREGGYFILGTSDGILAINALA